MLPTKIESEILSFIQRYMARRGVSPSQQEIARHRGVSQATIHGQLDTLEQKGLIFRPRNGQRAIELRFDSLKGGDAKQIRGLALETVSKRWELLYGIALKRLVSETGLTAEALDAEIRQTVNNIMLSKGLRAKREYTDEQIKEAKYWKQVGICRSTGQPEPTREEYGLSSMAVYKAEKDAERAKAKADRIERERQWKEGAPQRDANEEKKLEEHRAKMKAEVEEKRKRLKSDIETEKSFVGICPDCKKKFNSNKGLFDRCPKCRRV